MTRTHRTLAAVAALVVTAFAATGAGIASADNNGLTVTFAPVSVGSLAATIDYSVNKAPNQIAGVTCTLARGTAAAVAASCGAQVSSTAKATNYRAALSGLTAASYKFAVTILSSGKPVTATTTFTVGTATASCTVTGYSLGYDGGPHTATGSCTGVGGATLPTGWLSLAATTHTNAGSYSDAWTFTDPTGTYAGRAGTVTDTITRAGQTISFGAKPTAPTAGGTYAPSATATSGLPVSFAVDPTTASVCSISNGIVAFTIAGVCTVNATQAGNGNWTAAPGVQQTFTIAAAGPPPASGPVVPRVEVNPSDPFEIQVPLPPCGQQTLSGGGCGIPNALDGTVDNAFDARTSTAENVDATRGDTFTYHWEIFYPTTVAQPLGGSLYSSYGINGYNSPVLTIAPNALPSLAAESIDKTWHVRLTVTLNGTDTAQLWFRFSYDAAFDISVSTDCQRDGFGPDSSCVVEAANLLPTSDPSIPGTKPSPSCTVTGYSLTYDGGPHTATGSCTGVGGAALPAEWLSVAGTTHTSTGSYTDWWSFTDPTGTYAARAGTVTDTITKAAQTITFGAAPTSPTVRGTYTPSANATSGLPVSLAIDPATASVCSISSGTVSFTTAGVCTVNGTQTGNDNWTAAPLAQQTFTIAPLPAASGPVVASVEVNPNFDTQIPRSPCFGNTLSGGGCLIRNSLDGNVDNFFDGRTSTAVNVDPARGDTFTYHWEIFYPPTVIPPLGGSLYTSYGINGYNSPVLSIAPNSLPSLADESVDRTWHARLTVTLNGTFAAELWFRFSYDAAFDISVSTDCQRLGIAAGSTCIVEAANLLPTSDPSIPGAKPSPSCSVTGYTVSNDGGPHTATGSCTGVGGAALPAAWLHLENTTHISAGTYTDWWVFTDPTGTYTGRAGTVTSTIS